MAGVDTVVIDDQNDYSIGQSVTISPKSDMTITDQNGNSVGLTPGVSITGTITDKS
jgi:hypothetical protein